jgi:hypothetical protein
MIYSTVDDAVHGGPFIESFLPGNLNAGIGTQSDLGGIQNFRFDDTGVDDNEGDIGFVPGTHVITAIYDPSTQTLMTRKDGVVFVAGTAVLSGFMSAQAGIILGGQTFAEDNAFGDLHLAGTLGHVLVYNAVLSGQTLVNVENYVRQASRLI